MSRADGPNGTGPSPLSDYEWIYEYYDEEELVSFEGLKVHRYSIVIGFWVGLAVFVIFMFFLLTLLTKTGAPQPESHQLCEKPPCVIDYMDTDLNDVAPPSISAEVVSSCSLLNCYGSKMNGLEGSAGGVGGGAASEGVDRRPSSSVRVEERDCALLLQELRATANKTENNLLTHFHIPNCVNSEAVGEDDLLLEEPELSVTWRGGMYIH